MKKREIIPLILLIILTQGCNKNVSSDSEKVVNNNVEVTTKEETVYTTLTDTTIKSLKLTEGDIKRIQFYISEDITINLGKNTLTNKKIIKKGNLEFQDSQLVQNKIVLIKKFTPCMIVKQLDSEKEINKKDKQARLTSERRLKGKKIILLTREQYEINLKFYAGTNQHMPEEYFGVSKYAGIYEGGYEVDVGSGISLVYNSSHMYNNFTRIYSYEGKEIINPDYLSFYDQEELKEKDKLFDELNIRSNDAKLLFDTQISEPTIKNVTDTIMVTGKRKRI
jgi:hypothetical protein